MAAVTRVLPFLYLCSIYVTCSLLDGKAFYCRDPDTGKLHSINSTWPSTSFCGNYSCKLKKINITETKYTPIREYNISNASTSDTKNETNMIIEDMTNPDLIEKKVESDTMPIHHSNLIPKAKISENNTDSDRYLTESEIKALSEILHTIKRSDLDAIVEIYNLAQDINLEYDKQTLNNESESYNTVEVEESKAGDTETLYDNKPTSYWYEPLNVNAQKAARSIDLVEQGSNVIENSVRHKTDPKQSFNSNTFFSNNLDKSPYYYPMSNFQRMSSYVHPPTNTNPCNRPNEHALITKVLNRQAERLIQPSILLPYPFSYVNNFNTSYLNNNFYNPNLWSYYDFYRQRNYQPYVYINAYPTNNLFAYPQQGNQDAERNSVSKEENDILDDLIEKAKRGKLPDWKTPPLADQVLKEVRANIEKSPLLKPFPFRKKINLEKVGKLIKLDEFSRSKRDTYSKLEEDETSKPSYETFIETITCPPDTQMGYFRRGNHSEPYPQCCPQRIDKPAATSITKRANT